MRDEQLDLTTATLKQLEDAGFIGWLSEDDSDFVHDVRGAAGDKSLLETIRAIYPQCITGAGKLALIGFALESRPEIILEGIQVRTPGEKPATAKQIHFLKCRFRIDEAALGALDEWQAHAAIKLILENLGNRGKDKQLTQAERDTHLHVFLFKTQGDASNPKYGLWTELDHMPLIQASFDKPTLLRWLATMLQDVGKTVVFIARNGSIVSEAERADLISEAAEMAADYVSDRGPLAEPIKRKQNPQ